LLYKCKRKRTNTDAWSVQIAEEMRSAFKELILKLLALPVQKYRY
jgi:hypothetical protein